MWVEVGGTTSDLGQAFPIALARNFESRTKAKLLLKILRSIILEIVRVRRREEGSELSTDLGQHEECREIITVWRVEDIEP